MRGPQGAEKIVTLVDNCRPVIIHDGFSIGKGFCGRVDGMFYITSRFGDTVAVKNGDTKIANMTRL